MKKRTYSDYVYYAILFTTILLVIIYPIIKNNIESPKFWILENLKIYCPGCGCTRAFEALCQGKILESIYYNSAVIYTVTIATAYVISHTISRITKKEKIKMQYGNVYLYSGMILLMINCIIKNIFFII